MPATSSASPSRFAPELLAGLDEPVRRYLTHAVREGASLEPGVHVTMAGRIKVGAWLRFRAEQDCDGRSFAWRARAGWGPLAIDVLDRYAGGAAAMDGRLLGRIRLFHTEDEDTVRSAAGRAAVESIFSPVALMPGHGVTWRAESDDHIVATRDIEPERPEVHLRIDERGAVRTASVMRWGKVAKGRHDYIPCGCDVAAERRFGDLVIPSRVSVAWWFGTPRSAPFFEATILDARRTP
jgi:hypothetical protein